MVRILLILLGLVLGTCPGLTAAPAPPLPAEPPGPTASPAVQKLLGEAAQLVREQKPSEALAVAERALAAARAATDIPGEARAHRARATALQTLKRDGEAVTAWRDAASA